MASILWTRDQLIEVLKLYCVTRFGRMHARNLEIVALAERLGRTPSAVALKMVNFVSLDPTLEQKGMGNSSKLDAAVWAEFFADIDSYLDTPGESLIAPGFEEMAQTEYQFEDRIGADIAILSTSRRNQSFFRNMILASYDGCCALTGIDEPKLLIASHIIPWSVDPALRVNPRNGICLNALHDKAFDCGLISFSDDYSIMISSSLRASTLDVVSQIGHDKLKLPSRFRPDPSFLAYHREYRFKP